jgi:cyanophycinase
MEALGSGLVILVDGRNISDTNITDVNIGEPISIKNLVVHVMSKSDKYLLKEHQFTIHNH